MNSEYDINLRAEKGSEEKKNLIKPITFKGIVKPIRFPEPKEIICPIRFENNSLSDDEKQIRANIIGGNALEEIIKNETSLKRNIFQENVQDLCAEEELSNFYEDQEMSKLGYNSKNDYYRAEAEFFDELK